MLKYQGHSFVDAATCTCCVTDAKRLRSDPTGTGSIRRAFAAAIDIRWRAVRALLRTAIAQQYSVSSFGPDASLRVSAFAAWLSNAIGGTVADSGLARQYVSRAYELGVRSASAMVGSAVSTPARSDVIATLAVHELTAIQTLVVQQASRAFAQAVLESWTAARLVREISDLIDGTGIARSRLAADHVIVRAFNEATLDVFERAGRTHVDVLPELRPVTRVGDAAKKKKAKAKPKKRSRKTGPGSRSSRARTPSSTTIGRIQKLESETEKWARRRLIGIETAEDDRVCQICLRIADEGPYTINTARALIPAHPRCRCAFVPVIRSRRVKDKDFDESEHTRVGRGYSEGGQFSESRYGRTLSREEQAKLEPRWEVFANKKDRERRKQAVRSWMGGNYEEINDALRNSHWQTGPEQRNIRMLNDVFDRASHELPYSIRVYRGVSTNHEFADVKEGDIVSDKGFNSTATDRSFAKEFVKNMPNRALVQITVPKGRRVFSPVVSGDEGMFDDNESEILLPRDTRYRITKKRGNVIFAEVM